MELKITDIPFASNDVLEICVEQLEFFECVVMDTEVGVIVAAVRSDPATPVKKGDRAGGHRLTAETINLDFVRA